MTRQSLLIISFSDIANDARVLKQVRAFSEVYDVTTCGFGSTPLAGVEHIEVHPDAVNGGLAARLRAAAGLLLGRIGWFSATYWGIPYVHEARELLAGRRFDVALANDVDTVALAARSAGWSKVHADLHEFFPGIHSGETEEERRQTAYLTWLVRRFASRAASSTTVGAGIAEAYRVFGLDAGVVTNATPRMDLAPQPVGSPIRLVHSGNAQPSRQLELIMNAAAASSADVTLDLLLMPNDLAYLEQLTQLADRLGERVRVLEPVAQSTLVATLNGYDVGVHVLPPTSFNNENALPNKFFDYVQARLGLLIGPSPEMVRVINEHDFGAVASGFSVDAIRAVIDELTPEVVSGWKQRSDEAADELSSDRQVQVWVDAVARLAGERA